MAETKTLIFAQTLTEVFEVDVPVDKMAEMTRDLNKVHFKPDLAIFDGLTIRQTSIEANDDCRYIGMK